ncbi:MAG: hypothetical protein SPL42_09025 [Bacteroidales bacterium]|nr:hypothetical protein [Bacteroidales bacterium]MDY6348547.1 hypothetical protein [Bacteroidales bacterium]
MRKKTILNTEMIETIREYFKTQPVLKAWLFGSYARGEETEEKKELFCHLRFRVQTMIKS